MEEIITEINENAIEQVVEVAAAAAPKKSFGVKMGKIAAVVGVCTLVGYGIKRIVDKKKAKEAPAANVEVIDNVKIAEHDFLDEEESFVEE